MNPTIKNKQFGFLLMLLAALMFAVFAMTIKSLNPRFDVWSIAFVRFLGGLVVFLLLQTNKIVVFSSNTKMLLIIRSLSGVFAFLLLIYALQNVPFSTAMFLHYTSTVFAALFSYILYRECLDFSGVISILLMMVGVAAIFEVVASGSYLGMTAALCSGVFVGLSMTILKRLREENNSGTIYIYYSITGLLVTAPFIVVEFNIPVTIFEWTMFSVLILSSLLAQLLMTKAFLYCSAWEGNLILTTELIFTAIAGYAFFKEVVSTNQVIGGIVILTSVVLTVLTRGRPQTVKKRYKK